MVKKQIVKQSKRMEVKYTTALAVSSAITAMYGLGVSRKDMYIVTILIIWLAWALSSKKTSQLKAETRD